MNMQGYFAIFRIKSVILSQLDIFNFTSIFPLSVSIPAPIFV